MVVAFGLAAIGLLSLGAATTGAAQGCSGCTIAVTKVVTLRAPEDSTGFTALSSATADSRGRILVSPIAEAGRLHAFDADGRYVRTIGRAGSGPGEFRRLGRVISIAGDSTLVFDNANAKMSVLDPSYRVAREVRLSGVVGDAVRLRDGTLIVVGSIGPRKQPNDPYFVVGDSGVVRSFGRGTDTSREAFALRASRRVASSRQGGFWSGHGNQYRIDYLDVAAPPKIVVRRDVPWFPKWATSAGPPSWIERPKSSLSDLREDDQGLLWTFLRRAPADWKPATNVSVRPELPIRMPPINEFGKYIEFVIEVIDPQTGNVLATTRLPGSFGGGLVGKDMIAETHETPDGDIELILYRLALVRPR